MEQPESVSPYPVQFPLHAVPAMAGCRGNFWQITLLQLPEGVSPSKRQISSRNYKRLSNSDTANHF